jgi:ABC-type nickel/cobalt efflux system permease component RcnA
MSRRPVPRSGRIAGAMAAVALALLVPAVALAHPLGNFTINHYAALRIAPDRISLDVVIDRAEIPAFQEQQRLDTDGDGVLGGAELEAARQVACGTLASDLRLAVDGRALTPSLVAAGLALPPGAGGLPTMRLVCEFEAALASPISASTAVTFEDRSFAERIGWREIVVLVDGVTVTTGATGAQTSPAGAEDVSDRLTTYPKDLLTQPLDMRSIAVDVAPGGAALGAFLAPDAQPLAAPPAPSGPGPIGAVPGGIAEDLAALVDVSDLTPLAILGSLAIAFSLGIVHALSPGHGKTIMAAYLVGAKGSSRQAFGLGLAVAVSHTLGVLALAAITLAASNVLPPERLYPILGVVSGGLVIAIGGSLLWSRLRAMGLGRPHQTDHGHEHGHDARGHDHAHTADHAHDPDPEHGHPHPHPHPHSHVATDTTISWRGLIALGLSGGLVPSASALILLLGSIAAGRVAYGLVLVIGFGLGMAVVLAGTGLLIVNARRLIERRPSMGGLRRIAAPIQLGTASLVVVLGIVLTGQALTQVL